MKTRTKLTSLVLALLMLISVFAAAPLTASAETSDDDYEFIVFNDGTAKITRYIGSAAEVTIPDELDGYTVTSIGNNAFWNCTSLESITIPNSVTSIGYNAFVYCPNLASITIPDSVTSIGSGTFSGCTSLTGVTIPDSVTSIGSSTFSDCTSLTGVTIPDKVTSIGSSTFSDCTSLTGVTIPDSVTSIGNSAFYKCSSLTSVNIPDGVTSIGYDAFSGCSNLESINIPDKVTSIDSGTFSSCTSLGSITIPDSVTSIGDLAFSGCKSLTSITIPDSVTSIGDLAFSGCKSLTSITIPDSVTSIGDRAFSGCTSLTSITISSNVASISYEAFSGCTSLENVVLGKGVSSINSFSTLFYYCSSIIVDDDNENYSSLDGVLYNKDRTELIKYPVEKADKSFTIPDSVTNIGDSAFSDCTSLESITIPDSVTTIDRSAFAECNNLASVTIPDNVTSIGDFAFYNCSNLVDVTIGNSVSSIGECAFEYCTSLASIIIPASVTSIGESAFYNCRALKDLYYGGTKAKWNSIDTSLCKLPYDVNIHFKEAGDETDNYLYKILDNNTIEITGYVGDKSDVTVPRKLEGCTVSSIASFGYNPGIKNLTVPDCVTSIGYEAFNGCNKLTKIKLPDSITSIGEDAFSGTAYQSNSKNWENGCLYIGHHLVAAYPKNGLCIVKNGTITIATCIYCPHEDIDTYSVVIPASVKHIGYHAFGYYYAEAYYDDPDMGTIEYYESHKVNLTVYGKKGTAAEKYAKDNGFTFKELTSISKCKVSGIKTKTYNGKAQTQSVTVKVGTKTLKKGTDYTISYKNNKNAGTATMIITGERFYADSVKKTFKINKAANPMTVKAQKTVTAKSAKKTTIKKAVTASKAQGKVTYKTNNKKVTIKNGKMVVAKGLTSGKTYKVKITVSAKGNKNYKSGKKVVTVKIKIK